MRLRLTGQCVSRRTQLGRPGKLARASGFCLDLSEQREATAKRQTVTGPSYELGCIPQTDEFHE